MPGYSIETYQRPDGWWSFRINGVESCYRSSNQSGLDRTIRWLLAGRKPGTVQIPALAAGSQLATGGGEKPSGDAWADLPTTAERIAAFLRRGKLGQKAEGE